MFLFSNVILTTARYASEVDVDFVRKAIKAIGQTAIKIDAAAERCVNVLLELIDTRVSYVVQEAVVVMKVRHILPYALSVPDPMQDIFRKYPSTYEGTIPTLCANLEELDEPEAKASLIWIIGEYASKIDNADELLGIFVETFTEESYPVRLYPSMTGSGLLTMISAGSTSNSHGSRQTLFDQTRLFSSYCTACAEHCYERLRLSRRPRSSLHLLEITLN